MPAEDTRDLAPIPTTAVVPLFERALANVREEMRDNPYMIEALRVLPVGGYRSAIGCFWNAVVDDLRNKIIFRSLSLFNKSVSLAQGIKTYEDFQNHVNDDTLIEGAYKIGVIGWEASKMLRHAKETRHIFDGHPRSSEPSIVKVLAMMDDCIKYVLNADYPPQIIDIDEYVSVMGTEDFDRNEIAIENSFGDLPETYKNELANRLFAAYIHADASTVLRSNIEFSVPILWGVLPKPVKVQIVRRVDQVISQGNATNTEQAFAFVRVVRGMQYLSTTAKKYKVVPLVKELADALDQFAREDAAVYALVPFAAYIPPESLPNYVSALTHTYVGHMGASSNYSRTDFYANKAALMIPGMVEKFDNAAAAAFVACIKTSDVLRRRLRYPAKLRRLRSLANTVLERVSESFADRAFLETLAHEDSEEEFFKLISSSHKVPF